MNALHRTVAQLGHREKIIAALDESPSTIDQRFGAIGIVGTPELRLKWRQLLLSAPGFGRYVSGVILHPELMADDLIQDRLREEKVVLIVKIDGGLTPLGGNEHVTKIPANIAELLDQCVVCGAGATKFRSVFRISDSTPTQGCIDANSKIQAQAARASQHHKLVPMVEPEVLPDGNHSITICEEVTKRVLGEVFQALYRHSVHLGGMVLKPNMVTPGESFAGMTTPQEVAEATLRALTLSGAPMLVPAINFLSGGWSDALAEAYLNAIAFLGRRRGIALKFSASFGRAATREPLKIWAGKDENIAAAQAAFLERLARYSLARQGLLTT